MARQRPRHGDVLDVIEVASAVLVRNFEMLRRRSDVYTELDCAEYLLLRTLDEAGPLDICTLAGTLGLDPSTAGRQVTAMRAKDLVARRETAADRRRTVVATTEKGRDRMMATRARRREETAALLAGWTDDELRSLADTFTRYNQAVAQRFLNPASTAQVSTSSPVAAQILLPPGQPA